MARKTFKFKMQRLLNVRVMRKKQAQAELLTRKANLAREVEKLASMREEETVLVDRMTLKPGQHLDIQGRQETAYALEQHRKKINTQERTVIPKHEGLVAEQTEVLMQASIKVKALEKLEEKHREEFHEEQLREQAVFLDDLASQQFIRNRSEGERHAEEALRMEETS